ncbi:hypothetical protein GGR56DRAFT_639418 [Xylariaceae sp. FL0804]|nr:hypothetical protein GGR56DRAFT_639418 [Xylariaceae sp. FL0804]
MDPVSAIGVAAAAVAFLDFSVEVVKTWNEIRDSTDFATSHNKELEEMTGKVRGFRQELAHPSQTAKVPKRISDIAKQCVNQAEKLEKLLKETRRDGKVQSTARSWSRAVRGRKPIEELLSSLAKTQKMLDEVILQELLGRFDEETIRQCHRHTTILDRMQQLAEVQHEETRALNTNVEALSLTTQSNFDQVRHQAQNISDHEQKRVQKDKLLQSLFYPEIDERRDNIKGPAPGTLNWIFDPNEPGSDFGVWLCQDDPTYWISGKAGSGKSTLMAHLVEDARTTERLRKWSQGQKLHILSFFFWRPGSSLQKSVLGLLRSLLYQVLRGSATPIDRVLQSLSINPEIMPNWTEKRLLGAIKTLIGLADMDRFCVFIDGLDEYGGEYSELIDWIEGVQTLNNIKLCVSSRPEIRLVKRLEKMKHLRLQDLNRGDIEEFVKQKLHRTDRNQEGLIRKIVYSAEGVFLWAALVTQSLIEGLDEGDDEEMLWEQLNTMPKGIEPLFQHMLDKIKPHHRKSLAFFLKCMDISRGFYGYQCQSIALWTAAGMDIEIISYDEFATLCQRTELQVTAQSAGLLEIVTSNGQLDRRKKHWRRSTAEFISEPWQDNDDLSGRRLTAPHSCQSPSACSCKVMSVRRRECEQERPFPEILWYEWRYVRWVHRSAYDFILETQSHLVGDDADTERALERLCAGYTKYMRAAPSYLLETTSLTSTRFSDASYLAKLYLDDYPETISTALDNIRLNMEQLDRKELSYDKNGPIPVMNVDSTADRVDIKFQETMEPPSLDGTRVFWYLCAKQGLCTYILSRLDIILDCDDPTLWLFVFLIFLRETRIQRLRGTMLSRLAKVLIPALRHKIEERLDAELSDSVKSSYLYTTNKYPSAFTGTSALTGILSVLHVPQKRTRGSVLSRQFLGTAVLALWKLNEVLAHLDAERRSILAGTPYLQLLLNHLTASDTYIGFGMRIPLIDLQVTAEIWWKIQTYLTDTSILFGRLLTAVTEYSRPLRVLFAPWKKHRDYSWDYGSPNTRGGLVEGTCVAVHPSPATTQLFISFLGSVALKLPRNPDGEARLSDRPKGLVGPALPACTFQSKLEELCELLLEDIKDEAQGLDVVQQLSAASCVQHFKDTVPRAEESYA